MVEWEVGSERGGVERDHRGGEWGWRERGRGQGQGQKEGGDERVTVSGTDGRLLLLLLLLEKVREGGKLLVSAIGNAGRRS